MFKYTVVICALIACVAGKPGLLHTPLAAPAAIIAAPAPVVTATSSQVVARNFNGIAAAPLIAAAPVGPVVRAVAPVAAPFAAPILRHVAPVAAPLATPFAAPVATPFAAPIIRTVAPVAAPLTATAFTHPLAAPLHYAAPPAPIFF